MTNPEKFSIITVVRRGVAQFGRVLVSKTMGRGFESFRPCQKNSTSFDLSIFLFKPQAWYGITRQRVWYRRRRMASPKVHFLRLDSIPSCNGFHTMLCIDSIHAFRRDVAHEFKSILKQRKVYFLSVLHKKSKSKSLDFCFLFGHFHITSLSLPLICLLIIDKKY